jgi:Arc/MetJ-type ribon-helix-helix transcriptional regulator
MITLRSDDMLDEKLAEIVATLRADGQAASRSSVVRAILHRHLATDEEQVLVREAMRTMHRVLRSVTSRAVDALTPQLPEFVEDALRESDEGPA